MLVKMSNLNINLTWLEAILKEKNYEDVNKLLSVEANPAVADGENYVSKIFRLTIQAVNKQGNQKQLSLILKMKYGNQLDNKDMEEKIEVAFDKEYKVYVDQLVHVGKYTLDREQLWPQCLASKPGLEIYFEDLKATGHKLANRCTGLDADHTLLTINSLANLHAASTIAVARGELDPTRHKKYFMVGTTRIENLLRTNEVEMMVDVIRKEWGLEWSHLADRLEKYQNSVLLELVSKIGNYKEDNFNTFNHGDPWVSNFMYKYDSNGKPVSMKFVDFQIFHYNSFALDLCYFLNTSVTPELKEKYLQFWIESYCNTFSKCLKQHSCSVLPSPSPEMVTKEINRLSPFSLLVSLRIRPVVQSDPKDALTISEMWNDSGLNSKKRKIYQNPLFAEVMKSDLPNLLDIMDTYK